ncbi:HutD family protein [Serratia microhaemolytica]|uniref:HutD/Ves family protein n=1 Tax=Serratia microhaemolytica TaxID=2675110 RepID=UPI000FDEB35C|nr:HutD family protein [Serratia microhaemolytica]
MRLTRFSFAQLAVSRWRNGGGETREITSQPLGASQFDWRASIATIAQDGPFSAFPGIDRSITLLAGGGVHLFAAEGVDHRLDQIGVPFAFAGDLPLQAQLLAGSSQDFNIMTRRGRHSASVQRLVSSQVIDPAHAGVLYVLGGEWLLPDQSSLVAQQGVWWLAGEGPTALRLKQQERADPAAVLWAEIRIVCCQLD